MPNEKSPRLPAAGSAFAFPLEDGRFGACRVLLDTSSVQSKELWKGEAILAICSDWIWDEIPTADDPGVRSILFLSHHSWQIEPALVWLSEEVPSEFVPIGIVPPTVEESSLPCNRFGNWNSLIIQPLEQWRWDHEREAVLARDAENAQRDTERRRVAQQQRQAYLSGVTLNELRGKEFFPSWKEFPSPEAIRQSRMIMNDTVEKLIDQGIDSPEIDRMRILQECIEAFNDLDAKLHCIETVERDDICEEFEAIVHACGLGEYKDLADHWRDW